MTEVLVFLSPLLFLSVLFLLSFGYVELCRWKDYMIHGDSDWVPNLAEQMK